VGTAAGAVGESGIGVMSVVVGYSGGLPAASLRLRRGREDGLHPWGRTARGSTT
jgi:hypothetical protein